jgi:hypothetical protein
MWSEPHALASFLASRAQVLAALALTLSLAVPDDTWAQVPDAGPDTVRAG